MVETAVIIASWNGKKYLKDCFDSLAAQSCKNFRIIFVDNGSGDGSVDFVKENYAKNIFSNRLEIMKFDKNTGFARGYNAGIEKALNDKGVEFMVLLNNDAKLDQKCLEELISCAKKHSGAGSIQPKVLNFYDKDKIDCTGILFNGDGTATNRGYGEKDEGQYDNEEEIFGANGMALFTREALEKTQIRPGEYFDNDFFAYYEDTDLAWRLRLAGYKSYFCPEAVVLHIGSASSGKFSLFKAYHLHRNYFFAVFKNYPAGIMIKTLFLRFLSYIGLVFSVFEKKKRETRPLKGYGRRQVAVAILKAWVSVIANMPALFKKRYSIQKMRKVKTGDIKLWLKKYQAA